MATYRGSAGAELVLDLDAMPGARRQAFDAQIVKGDLTLVEPPPPKPKKAAPKPTEEPGDADVPG